MSIPVLRIGSTGIALTIQDAGRIGWKRWGIPTSGFMDDHAALWANRLLDNPAESALLEIQFQGAALEAVATTWIAITGADLGCNLPTWRVVRVQPGEKIQFRQNQSGLWAYLAVEGGFEAKIILGSRSIYPRGQIGDSLEHGSVLYRNRMRSFALPEGVAGRASPWTERRDYARPPALHVWTTPQSDLFTNEERERFFQTEWTISSQSDRAGYRLVGPPLRALHPEVVSEPVRIGTLQVPANGQPIITMRDGPTVGGYPRIGLVDRRDLSWVAQCRPGQKIRFKPVE